MVEEGKRGLARQNPAKKGEGAGVILLQHFISGFVNPSSIASPKTCNVKVKANASPLARHSEDPSR